MPKKLVHKLPVEGGHRVAEVLLLEHAVRSSAAEDILYPI